MKTVIFFLYRIMTNYDFDETALSETIDFTAFLKINCIRIPPSASMEKGCQGHPFFMHIKGPRGTEFMVHYIKCCLWQRLYEIYEKRLIIYICNPIY